MDRIEEFDFRRCSIRLSISGVNLLFESLLFFCLFKGLSSPRKVTTKAFFCVIFSARPVAVPPSTSLYGSGMSVHAVRLVSVEHGSIITVIVVSGCDGLICIFGFMNNSS